MRKLPSFIPCHKEAEELGLSLTTLKRWETLKGFPKPRAKLFGQTTSIFQTQLPGWKILMGRTRMTNLPDYIQNACDWAEMQNWKVQA